MKLARTYFLPAIVAITCCKYQMASAQAPYLRVQQPEYAKNEGYGIATDFANNVYTVGYYKDSIKFENTTIYGEGTRGFISKHTGEGKLLWLKNTTLSGFTQPRNVITDKQGNVFVSGVYQTMSGQVSVIPGEKFPSPKFTYGGFIIKYGSDGDAIWAKGHSDSRFDNGLSADDSGNVYTTGELAVKFTPAGLPVWSKAFQPKGYPSFEQGTLPGSNGDIYVTGNNYLLGKRNANGDSLWLKTIPGQAYNHVFGRAIAKGDPGFIYVAGSYIDTADFGVAILLPGGSGRETKFIAKCDTAGNIIWAKQFGRGQEQGGYGETVMGISSDAHGNVFIAGRITDSAYFGNITAYGYGAYAAKYSGTGDFLWVSTTRRGSKPTISMAEDIAVDGLGCAYITGFFEDTVKFDDKVLTTKNLEPSVFIAKLGPFSTGIDNHNSAAKNGIVVWPNPAKDMIDINLDKSHSFREVRLIDQAGRLVAKEDIPEHTTTKRFNIGNVATGVYYVQLVGNSGSETAKIVVQH